MIMQGGASSLTRSTAGVQAAELSYFFVACKQICHFSPTQSQDTHEARLHRQCPFVNLSIKSKFTGKKRALSLFHGSSFFN